MPLPAGAWAVMSATAFPALNEAPAL